MTTQETTEKKPTCKNAGVSPTAWHETPYKTWWGYVSIDGELTFTKVYKSDVWILYWIKRRGCLDSYQLFLPIMAL